MEDSSLLTAEDRNSLAYNACVAATSVIGMAVGGIGTGGNPLGVIAVGAAGFAYGTKNCPWMTKVIINKIKDDKLTEAEFSGVMNNLSTAFPSKNRPQLLDLAQGLLANIKRGGFDDVA